MVASQDINFTLVIPIFNEERSIETLFNTLERFTSYESRCCEIVLVNDGSTDNTPNLLRENMPKLQHLGESSVFVLTNEKNEGYGAALKKGILQASHPFIAITDCDGTYPTSALSVLADQLQNCDMVVAKRISVNGSIPLLKRVPKWLIRKYASFICGQSVGDFNSGLRLFNKRVTKLSWDFLPNGFSFTTTTTMIALIMDCDVAWVDVDYAKRTGKSKIRPFKDTLKFFKLVTQIGLCFRPFYVFGPPMIVMSCVFAVLFGVRIFAGGGFAVSLAVLGAFGTGLAFTAVILDTLSFSLKSSLRNRDFEKDR